MPASLSCPTCGAPAPSLNASSCEYCGSILTTVACPSCFGTMFAGMDFCPHCGTRAARAVSDDAPPLNCPGCKSPMRGVSVGQNAMHECPSCASLWLDAPTFTRLCTSHEERGAVVAFIDVDRSTTRTPSAAAAAVRYVPCPVCAKIMNRQNFGRRSGVVVDVCKGHGVWFEANELQAALAFIDSGGFERARQDEEARKAEERAKLVKEFEQTGKELLILDRVQMSHQHGHTVSVHGTASPPDSALADVLRAFFS